MEDSDAAKLFAAYRVLRNKIDERCEEIEPKHRKHMQCAKGCSSCCIKYSIFPLEFAYIKSQLNKSQLTLPKYTLKKRLSKACVFLVNDSCSIYAYRPIICRTQGFPLMYQKMDGTGYELSACELNFTDFNFENFTVDNSVYMPQYNSELYLLNKSFVDIEGKHKPNVRIPISDLLKDK